MEHLLSVEKRGYVRKEVKVKLEAGAEKEFNLDLDRRKSNSRRKQNTNTQRAGAQDRGVEKSIEKKADVKPTGLITISTKP